MMWAALTSNDLFFELYVEMSIGLSTKKVQNKIVYVENKKKFNPHNSIQHESFHVYNSAPLMM